MINKKINHYIYMNYKQKINLLKASALLQN